MKTGHLRFVIAMLAVVLLGTQQALPVNPSILNKGNARQREKWVNDTYSKLSPVERIAQIIIMPLRPGDDEGVKARVRQYVEGYKVGGLIYDKSDIVRIISLIRTGTHSDLF